MDPFGRFQIAFLWVQNPIFFGALRAPNLLNLKVGLGRRYLRTRSVAPCSARALKSQRVPYIPDFYIPDQKYVIFFRCSGFSSVRCPLQNSAAADFRPNSAAAEFGLKSAAAEFCSGQRTDENPLQRKKITYFWSGI